jgi:hypothetical protein
MAGFASVKSGVVVGKLEQPPNKAPITMMEAGALFPAAAQTTGQVLNRQCIRFMI